MLIDAADLADGEVVRGDVCILGAGAGGLTLAMELAAAGRDVVVLESGGTDTDEATQKLAGGTVTGEQFGNDDSPLHLEDTRLRLLGGTTGHWSGYCKPFQAIDFEGQPGLDLGGWPISLGDVEPWYERSASILQLTSSTFDFGPWAAQEPGGTGPELSSTAFEPWMFQLSDVHFGTTYRDELERSPRIRIVLHANVTDIRTARAGGPVTEVRAVTLGGKAVRAEAKAFVLALGGIENARLLLASHGTEPAGLGNGADQVGRYFCEHLQATLGVGILHAEPAATEWFNVHEVVPPGATDDRKVRVGGVWALSEAARRERGLPGFDAQWLASDFTKDGPAYLGGLPAHDIGDLAARVSGTRPKTVGMLQGFGEQTLNPESRVTIARTTDATGVGETVLNWAVADRDRVALITSARLLATELGRTGKGRLQLVPGAAVPNPGTPQSFLETTAIDPGGYDEVGFDLSGGNHHMCTTRMSGSERTGVVDRDCRVHTVPNLWVAGSSVFGTAGMGTPTFTLIALAARLADHLDTKVL